MNDQTAFFWKRLFSLSGVFPIGVFLILHFYSASFSVKGPEAFNNRLETMNAKPWMTLIEVLLIYVPLLFHGIFGLALSVKARYNPVRYPFFHNVRFALQRVSGIGLFFFIAAHVYKTRVEPWMQGIPMNYDYMAEHMRDPLTFTVYVLGIIGAAYHLANGLVTFCFTWGITISDRAQARIVSVAMALFIIIAFFGINSIFGFLGRGINV